MVDTPIWAYGILGYNVNLRSTQSNSKESLFFNQVSNLTPNDGRGGYAE